MPCDEESRNSFVSDGLSELGNDKDDELDAAFDNEDEIGNSKQREKSRDPFHGMCNDIAKGQEIIFRVGQTFAVVYALRETVRNYAIKKGYELVRKKSDIKRLTIICGSDRCPWRLYATRLADQMTFMIKSLQDKHMCVRPTVHKNSNCTTKWIVKILKEKLIADPDMSYELMQHELLENRGIEAPLW